VDIQWFPFLSAIGIFCGEGTPSNVGGEYSDIGTGIPAAGNVHEVAREMAPDVRVIYVDNDPTSRTATDFHSQDAVSHGTRVYQRAAPGRCPSLG
jgi:S-adenosyl methyltransferase